MAATRRQAREWAIQMLTAADLNPPENVPTFLEQFWTELGSLDEDEGRAVPIAWMKRFAEERVTGVLSSVKELDAILVPLLDHWDLYRLGTVERCVLRMGIWEMAFAADPVPPTAAINEAVDLVNWFSTPKARSLVNGVLDKYAKSRAAQQA